MKIYGLNPCLTYLGDSQKNIAIASEAQKDFQPETRAGGLVIASVGIYTKNIIAMLA